MSVPSTKAPEPLATSRGTDGKFTTHEDPYAVTPVLMADGFVGYRVGPNGWIWTKKEKAEAHARSKKARHEAYRNFHGVKRS